MMSRFLKVDIIESGIVEYGIVESGIVHSGVLGWGCNVPKSPYHRYFHENRPKTSQNARNSVNYCHENRPKVSQTAINSVKCAKTSKKSQMPCPSTGPKMFCAGQNFLNQSKHSIVLSVSSKPFVPAQKQNMRSRNYLLVWHKMFGTGTKCIQIFGQAQNILERVEGH